MPCLILGILSNSLQPSLNFMKLRVYFMPNTTSDGKRKYHYWCKVSGDAVYCSTNCNNKLQQGRPPPFALRKVGFGDLGLSTITTSKRRRKLHCIGRKISHLIRQPIYVRGIPSVALETCKL